MRRTILAGFTAALLIFVLPTGKRVGAEAPLYTIQDLGDKFAGFPVNVTGVNASGEASGFVSTTGGSRAVRFRDGAWDYVPGLADVTSVAFAINDHGDIAGFRTDAAIVRAFRYTDATGVLDVIDPPPGGSRPQAMAINNNGDVVGNDFVGGVGRAWRAAPGLPAVLLPTLGGTFGNACGINDAGQVVGQSALPDNRRHAYRAEPDGQTITDLGTFDGGAGSSSACGIDAKGNVSGQAQASGQNRAFLFEAGLLNLDGFSGSSSSALATVNGTTVGFFSFVDSTNTSVQHAFAYNPKDGSFDLNTRIPAESGWVLKQAKGVNASGVIVGTGTLNGVKHEFMLTPPSKDTTPPTINSVSLDPASIVPPPDKRMVAVTVTVNATDDRDVAPTCSVSGIDGHGAPDANFSVTGPLSGSVRAVGGSTYTFHVSCKDAAGNEAVSSADVAVPPDTTGPVFTNLAATPATIAPPAGQMVPVSISVSAIDDSGDVPACRLAAIISSSAAPDSDAVITGATSGSVRAVGGRTYTLNAVCTDSSNNSSSAATAVYVPPDTTAPVIRSVSASPYAIWPANGKMVGVSVSVTATDDVDAMPACAISSIDASELAPGDAVITGNFTAQVRATRNSDNSTRFYTLHVRCADMAGNAAEKTVNVRIAKDGDASSGTPGHHGHTIARREWKEPARYARK